jgi:hypothetical protein
MKITKPRPKRQQSGGKRITKYAYHCHGGPMDGQTLYLESDTTLTFTLAGQTGYYKQGVWICA